MVFETIVPFTETVVGVALASYLFFGKVEVSSSKSVMTQFFSAIIFFSALEGANEKRRENCLMTRWEGGDVSIVDSIHIYFVTHNGHEIFEKLFF